MNRQKLYSRYKKITQVRYLEQVGFLIGHHPHTLVLQAMKPHYDIFYISKRNGKKRLIENPTPVLKKIQRALNKYLQVVYYRHCPPCSHGFVINIKKGKHRSIVSNAEAHLGCRYMVKLDMKDFFHTVNYEHVNSIFQSEIFAFDSKTCKILTDLCCFSGRLPMGAPTSPALSNLASISLDKQISDLCQSLDVCYTRYADDMTLSSKSAEIPSHLIDALYNIVTSEGFSINPDKTHFLGAEDSKEVTGIIVHEDRLSLSDHFISDTLAEIEKLKSMYRLSNRYNIYESNLMQTHKRRIDGFINYAAMIYGDRHPEILNIYEQRADAVTHSDFDEPMSWSEFPYSFFT